MTTETKKRWQLTKDDNEYWQDVVLWPEDVSLVIDQHGIWRDMAGAMRVCTLTREQCGVIEVLTGRPLARGDRQIIETRVI